MKPKTKITVKSTEPSDVEIRPGLSGKFDELFALLGELEKNTSEIRGKLFSEGEGSGSVAPLPSSIDGSLAYACARVASLVGETATILARF